MKHTISIEFALDTKFIAILPSLNYNRHSNTIEFEWLIFAMYIDLTDQNNK